MVGRICGCWGCGGGCGGGGGGGWDSWVWLLASLSSLSSDNEVYHMLVMRHIRHAKMVLGPTRRVVLEGELWGALVGIPVVSNIVHSIFHGSKIVESRGNQW